ncbi:hypothetical protein [Bradyrhizobium elkanii]|uniref:hypothetical protein n=1 Tax=Bradyrhizobium elkanii TaxID=29448 RepID=UPI00216A93D5|nr:hypothetical protein [Bradyrhizobium elkanii]MCS3690949.1 hypothetical protein [Bradyrhizobium elkanii]
MDYDFGALAPADKPFRVVLLLDGESIKDEEGNEAYIDVYSMDSAAARKYDKDERIAALESARSGKQQSISDPLERNYTKLAALTSSWYLVDPTTKLSLGIPCNADTAKALYLRPNTGWISDLVWRASGNNENFIIRSAKGSTPTQSGSSVEAAE